MTVDEPKIVEEDPNVCSKDINKTEVKNTETTSKDELEEMRKTTHTMEV